MPPIFLLNDGRRFVFGKNYDWHIRSGMLTVNQRGIDKVSIADSGGNPARWTSLYGSVTFNQFGREFPMGGMNVLKRIHDIERPRNEALVQRYVEIAGRVTALGVGTFAIEMIMQGLSVWIGALA